MGHSLQVNAMAKKLFMKKVVKLNKPNELDIHCCKVECYFIAEQYYKQDDEVKEEGI